MSLESISHVLSAAHGVCGWQRFTLMGPHAALLEFSDKPELLEGMLHSCAHAIWPEGRPELAPLISGILGRKSYFHGHFGYYAEVLDPATAILPEAWDSRAITWDDPALFGGVSVTGPDIHDLAISRVCLLRESEFAWVDQGINAGIIDPEELCERIMQVPETTSFTALEHLRALSWISSRVPGGEDCVE